jgi:glucose/arabinose dehydrogenase
VAGAPDGSILLATDRGWPPRAGEVLRLTPGGRLRTLTRLDGGVLAIAADGGGSVLALQRSRVVRLRASGGSMLVAGTGRAGFSGDGGPATSARLDAGTAGGIARAADGSIAFTDGANDRLRRIRPDGVIETIAGVGVPAAQRPMCHLLPSNGDGGPARSATLCQPGDVIVAAGGGYIVSDTRAGRVRRIAPDGTITTLAGNGSDAFPPGYGVGRPATEVPLEFPGNLAQLPDGTVVVSASGGYGRVLRDGTWDSLFGQFGDTYRDFVRRVPGGAVVLATVRHGR